MPSPINEPYRENPQTAMVTLKAQGQLGAGVTCSIHPGKALVGCAGVTLSAVPTATGMVIRSGSVRAEGDSDFRGTLAVSKKDVPVGFQRIRLIFDLDTGACRRTNRDVAAADRTLLRGLLNLAGAAGNFCINYAASRTATISGCRKTPSPSGRGLG